MYDIDSSSPARIFLLAKKDMIGLRIDLYITPFVSCLRSQAVSYPLHSRTLQLHARLGRTSGLRIL